jgi:hypothetical protein
MVHRHAESLARICIAGGHQFRFEFDFKLARVSPNWN